MKNNNLKQNKIKISIKTKKSNKIKINIKNLNNINKNKTKNSNEIEDYNESKVFKFNIRTQLTCSRSRPDTYFAIYNSKPVFVKGPYESKEKADITIKIYKLK